MIRFVLQSERLGPLPLVNHFIQHMGLEDTLDRYVPSDQRCAVSHARTLGVLLTSAVPAWIQINRPGKYTPNCFFNLRKVSIETGYMVHYASMRCRSPSDVPNV